VTKDWLFI